jgi:hypothetical protein
MRARHVHDSALHSTVSHHFRLQFVLPQAESLLGARSSAGMEPFSVCCCQLLPRMLQV